MTGQLPNRQAKLIPADQTSMTGQLLNRQAKPIPPARRWLTLPSALKIPRQPSESCCICFEPACARAVVRLACSHSICVGCSTAASLHGHDRCPLCRRPHNLDVSQLRERAATFRENYASWRHGAAAGARGELAHISRLEDDISAPRRPSGSHASLNVNHDLHCAVAGTLAVATVDAAKRPRDESALRPTSPPPRASSPRTIFTYWHQAPVPGVSLRCIQSMREMNPSWRVVVS